LSYTHSREMSFQNPSRRTSLTRNVAELVTSYSVPSKVVRVLIEPYASQTALSPWTTSAHNTWNTVDINGNDNVFDTTKTRFLRHCTTAGDVAVDSAVEPGNFDTGFG
jgi:hypothetical protein